MSEEIVENNESLLDRLSNLISKALERINENKLEIDSLNQINKSLEEFAAKESKIKEDLQDENEELNAKLDNLTGNNNYYSDLIKSLEINIEQNAHYKIEYEHIREKYEKMLLENAELKEQVNTIPNLNKTIEEQSNKINELALLSNSYLNTIGKYEKALVDKELIQKDLASKNIRIYELLNEIQEYKEKVTIYESQLLKFKDYDKIINNYKLQIADFENEISGKISELNSLNYKLSVENAQLKDDLNNSKIDIGNVENEKNLLENQNSELNQTIDDLNNKVETLNIKIKQFDLESQRLSKINDSLTQEINLIKSNLEINQKELILSYDEVKKLKFYNNELIDEIENLERTITEKTNLINNLQETKSDSSKLLNDAIQEVNDLKTLIGRYEIEIDNLKSELSSSHNEKTIEYNNNLNDLERLNTDLQFQLEECQNELNNKIKDIKLLQNRMNEFIQELNSLKSEQAEQNLKISIFTNNENKHLTRISNLEELVKTRYEQINLLENKINMLLDEKIKLNDNKNKLIEMVQSTINDIDNEIILLKAK